MNRALATMATLAGTLSLAGCSVTGPPRLAREGDGIPMGAGITIESAAPGHPLDAQMKTALTDGLRKAGYAVGIGGSHLLRYAIAERGANVGIARAGEEGGVEEVSYSRKGLLLDRCEAQRMRVSLVAYDLKSGNAAWRGSAEFNDCAFDTAELDRLAGAIALQAKP